jgi:hypothetical protein
MDVTFQVCKCIDEKPKWTDGNGNGSADVNVSPFAEGGLAEIRDKMYDAMYDAATTMVADIQAAKGN